jgi:hypothetical protein
MAAAPRHGAADLPPLWRQREFMLLWSGQVVSTLGSHASGIVITLLILAAVFGVMMFAAPIYNVVQLSRRLAMIPDGLQGRVNSAFRLAANLLYPVGAALCGVLIEHGGTGLAVGVFGVVAAALLVVATAVDPVIRREGLDGASVAVR